MLQTKPVANGSNHNHDHGYKDDRDAQASAWTDPGTALVLFSQDTMTDDVHGSEAHQTLVPATSFSSVALDSPSAPSSPRPCSPPSSPPPRSATTPTPAPLARPKAVYRVTRLPRGEIERRVAMGRCTYCDDDSHTRTTCASGRLMRRVPKRVLNLRLGHSVCPFCGDPDRDKHCKATCPLRIELQAALDAKEAEFRSGHLDDGGDTRNPTEARAQRTAADAVMAAIERQTEQARAAAVALGRSTRTERLDWRGGVEDNGHAGDSEDQQPEGASRPAAVPKKKAFVKRPPMSKTNAPWRAVIVRSVPVVEAETETETETGQTEQPYDLIDLCTTLPVFAPPSSPSTTSSEVTGGASVATSVVDKLLPPLNLLDTEVTEVVWDNIVIPLHECVGVVTDCAEASTNSSSSNSSSSNGESDCTMPETSKQQRIVTRAGT
ncbi:hypothetical protein SPBR_09166 [Sporothrix brasiliensis 5110]|uniref:Uncharacterized protein n=1 Tax=Sporothrix brasiliensis 5110 TaxID=1398154 RepID=A0A0C2F495_9PEZI|nr:uncharacterized protein SPBR_09166 [Sporothrix brasiliensis 5110]KIH93729.1 hypothetical protein SPBR_09166 [Sporothrix brasiliensis 5110]